MHNEARASLIRFLDSGIDQATLGLVYGRRRIGKSTLLYDLTRSAGGFYWEATRGETAVQLGRLGKALGEHLGVGPLSLDGWEAAIASLLRLGDQSALPVVLDEFGYLLEAEPGLDSIVAHAFGPAARAELHAQTRLILCGSAIALMRALTAGEAPLRGRAGMELVMQPFGFREAARLLANDLSGVRSVPNRVLDANLVDREWLTLAVRVYSVLGGVVGYYTDMVDHDLPSSMTDFDRWIAQRVLSPAATLHHEATTLLAEDPTLAPASPALHHSILGTIANGSVTAGRIANRLRRSVASLDAAMKRLIAAGFVTRHEDPIRAKRPTYTLADPLLQFHFAVLEPNGPLLRGRDPLPLWRDRLEAQFDARVRGPVFEELARDWTLRHAAPATLGGLPEFVGPSTAIVDGKERQLDVLVASAPQPGAAPSDRRVLAIGEAKAGETLDMGHLRDLEAARAALGTPASQAKLLLFGSAFAERLTTEAAQRHDLEAVTLERLYFGS